MLQWHGEVLGVAEAEVFGEGAGEVGDRAVGGGDPERCEPEDCGGDGEFECGEEGK